LTFITHPGIFISIIIIIILYCLLFGLIFNVIPVCSCKKFRTEEVSLCLLCVPRAALQLSGVGVSPTTIGNICMSVLFMLHHRENFEDIVSTATQEPAEE
jgi:hypothetical protein